jgi:NAD(P)-dependent dehydrogenase (short-subunit alcohol dehydrogenase family)
MARIAMVTGGTRGVDADISEALRGAGYTVGANYAGNDQAASSSRSRLVFSRLSGGPQVECQTPST